MGLTERIELREVSLNDVTYLYELLKERDASITITQKNLPSLKEHKNFVGNQLRSINGNRKNIEKAGLDPYDGWYIITSDATDLGSIWIEEDGNIGLQVQKKFQKIGLGVIAFKKIQKMHKKENYKTTVSPNNNESIKFCEELGFTLKEKTRDRNIYTKSLEMENLEN
mgnify:CR=1 FL=1